MSKNKNILISSVQADGFNLTSACNDMIAFRWLGQAGFELLYKNLRLMIDPYLSDHLAIKYAGKEFPHIRMMQPPVLSQQVNDLGFILCTHRHSDHMDPAAIPIILKNNPACRLIAPKAEKQYVRDDICDDSQHIIFVNAGDEVELTADIKINVIASAHEDLKIDKNGNHHFLGYILKIGGTIIYHSGDCVVYDGLADVLKANDVDIAMLPVNGRDEYRRSRAVPGNMTFEEAVSLCNEADIKTMVCHHFGMFEFNTADEDALTFDATAVSNKTFECVVPKANLIYQVS